MPSSLNRRPSLLLLSVIYLAFVSLGLPDSVLGVAWTAIRSSFSLPLELAGSLGLTTTLFSATSSFAVGGLARRFGTGPIVLVSCLLTATALLINGTSSSFVFLLLACVPLGLGGGGVDSSLNAYVATHYSARHMNWLHSFWGVGATVGPILMTVALGSGGWRGGYLTIAAIQATLAGLFVVTLPLWKRNDGLTAEHHEAENGPTGTNRANSMAGALAVASYVLYVTVEFSAGLWANTVMVSGRGIPASTAGLWISAYYGSIMVGRLLSGFVVGRVGNRRMVLLGTAVALVGGALFAVSNVPLASLAGLVLLGLGFAPIYPCLMHETPRRFTAEAAPVVIGRQVGASYLGGAVLPGALGIVLAHVSLEALSPILEILIISLGLVVVRLNQLSKVSSTRPSQS